MLVAVQLGREQRDDVGGPDAVAGAASASRAHQTKEVAGCCYNRRGIERGAQIDQRLALGIAAEPAADEGADVGQAARIRLRPGVERARRSQRYKRWPCRLPRPARIWPVEANG